MLSPGASALVISTEKANTVGDDNWPAVEWHSGTGEFFSRLRHPDSEFRCALTLHARRQHVLFVYYTYTYDCFQRLAVEASASFVMVFVIFVI